jgi:hypothetical protein
MSILLRLLPVLLVVVLAGCGHLGGVTAPCQQAAPPAGVILTDLHTIGDLQNTFNQDAGKPQLIMLVSPT